MNMNMYSIFDTVAQVFNKPFTEINNATAIRAFSSAVNENPNKNDYALYHLGSFTDHDGVLVPIANPTRIYTGFDIDQIDVPETLKEQAK